MIVPMEQVYLIVTERAKDDALRKLRSLGVVHVSSLAETSSAPLAEYRQRRERVKEALRLLPPESSHPEKKTSVADGDTAAAKVLDVENALRQAQKSLSDLVRQSQWYREWGRVSLESLRRLADRSIFVKFYRIPVKKFPALSGAVPVYRAKEERGTVYAVLITRDSDHVLEFPEDPPPGETAQELSRRSDRLRQRIAQLQKEKQACASWRDILTEADRAMEKQIEFARVRQGMMQAAAVAYLTGYCPKEAVARLQEAAEKERWGYAGSEPANPQEVPTLLRNPRWLRIVNPVFHFMGTLPGYREFDVSLWFLVFFSLFFAMLIGDAGYGVLFLAAGIWARHKFRSAPKEPFQLLYVLAGSTIFWGAISGTWFGYEGFARLPLLEAVVIERIDSFVSGNEEFLMYFCFVIGAVHLSIAHALRAAAMLNSLRAVAQLGWIFIVWGVFFAANALVLAQPFPRAGGFLLAAGAGLAVLCSSPQKNMLKGVGLALADLPLKVINAFADVVSYLRLFAVGYASVIVASSFNQMALGTGMHPVAAGFIAPLILFLGHSLNIILGLMAVIVHGVRLNMLEFSSHLDMQWSGKPYRPFAEEQGAKIK
ncbi:MAG: hypothetical protein GF333_01815 [Candidatus Omnitrophica bacterium]|nr:hypothetical protein [Candidatus Omnitrophota bacterium]